MPVSNKRQGINQQACIVDIGKGRGDNAYDIRLGYRARGAKKYFPMAIERVADGAREPLVSPKAPPERGTNAWRLEVRVNHRDVVVLFDGREVMRADKLDDDYGGFAFLDTVFDRLEVSGTVTSGCGSPAVTNGISAARPCSCNRLKVPSIRLIYSAPPVPPRCACPCPRDRTD